MCEFLLPERGYLYNPNKSRWNIPYIAFYDCFLRPIYLGSHPASHYACVVLAKALMFAMFCTPVSAEVVRASTYKLLGRAGTREGLSTAALGTQHSTVLVTVDMPIDWGLSHSKESSGIEHFLRFDSKNIFVF